MRVASLLLLLLCALPLAASDGAAKYFGDVNLVDQHGRPANLYALLEGRTIVMNTFFASCTGSCPVMARTLLAVQKQYATRLGRDLVIVSITVDPEHDTPEKLAAYAKNIQAADGWYFLTGSREQIDFALQRIGQHTKNPEAHMNVIVAGNDRTGLWKKLFGLAKSEEIVEMVGTVLDDRGP